MKYPRFLTTIAALVALTFSSVGVQASDALVKLELGKWPALPVVSAPGAFAGDVGGALVILGGESASGPAQVLPLAAGATSARWTEVPAPFARSWGAVAQGTGEMIAVGGLENGRVSAAVDRLQWANGQLVRTELPALPVPLAGAGAALIGKKLYVVAVVFGRLPATQ